jgi:hypothetical protein
VRRAVEATGSTAGDRQLPRPPGAAPPGHGSDRLPRAGPPGP